MTGLTAAYALGAYVEGWCEWSEGRDPTKLHDDPVIAERYRAGWNDRKTFERELTHDDMLRYWKTYHSPCRSNEDHTL